MNTTRLLSALDYHTEGEPMRIIRAGTPALPGSTMAERSAHFATRYDGLRRFVLNEPRGHAAMCAAFLVPGCDPAADTGVVFVEPIGVVEMCGHGAIAIATMLVETGMVPQQEPDTQVTLDTAAGRVVARVHADAGRIIGATIRNVPAFSVAIDAKVDVPGLGGVAFDLAYCGLNYALVEAEPLGIPLVPEAAARIVAIGERIRPAIERALPSLYSSHTRSKELLYVQLYGPPHTPGAHLRNAVVVAPAGVDRSPCGTGTSARLANLWARRRIGLHQEFVHESIIGTTFRSRVVATTRVDGFEAVVPEITGRAFLSGLNQLVLKPDDPFPEGFAI